MLGVRISEPKQEISEKPRSSATMTRKLGRFGDAIVVLVSWSRTVLGCVEGLFQGSADETMEALDDPQDDLTTVFKLGDLNELSFYVKMISNLTNSRTNRRPGFLRNGFLQASSGPLS